MPCPQVLIRGPVRIRPSSKVGWLNPVSGNIIALTKVSPEDFGQKDTTNKYLQEWSFELPNMTCNALTSLESYLLELYDAVFPAWAGGVSISGQTRLQAQAHVRLKVSGHIGEPPLRPYCYALGCNWFGWLQKLVQ